MTLNDSRVARTQTSGHTTTARTQVTTVGGRRIVGAVVWLTEVWGVLRRAGAATAEWLRDTVRPAGAVLAVAGTAGLVLGLVFGWVEAIVAGCLGLLLLAMAVPFLFGGRSYDVDLTMTHQRVVAGDAVDGRIVVRNVGRRTALPGRLDVPVGRGLIEIGVPLLRPAQQVVQPVEIPSLRRGIVTVGPVTTVRGDPIGMLRRERAFEDVHELFVHPRTATLPSTSAGLIRDLEGAATRRRSGSVPFATRASSTSWPGPRSPGWCEVGCARCSTCRRSRRGRSSTASAASKGWRTRFRSTRCAGPPSRRTSGSRSRSSCWGPR